MSKSTNTNEKITLYRGVSGNHVKFKEALRGITTPRGEHSDKGLHNWGDTRSIYTSWTTQRWVAEDHALDGKKEGVVLEKEFKISEINDSPDIYDEWEVLIVGQVTDGDVYVITEQETKPVFDSKSGKYVDSNKF